MISVLFTLLFPIFLDCDSALSRVESPWASQPSNEACPFMLPLFSSCLGSNTVETWVKLLTLPRDTIPHQTP